MSRPSLPPALAALLAAMLGLMAGLTAPAACARRSEQSEPGVASAGGPPLEPASTLASAIAARAVQAGLEAARPAIGARPTDGGSTYTVERVRSGASVTLLSGPGRRAVARVGARTAFGSPQTLTVAARRGRWLGVTSTSMPNGRLAWVDARTAALAAARTRVSLRIDLARRRLELLDGTRVLRRASVGVGAPGSPTPSGRFAVTDKLAGAGYGAYYGCCILALSAHQTNEPAGWQGGDRLAIHGTDDPGSVGTPSSAGCIHAAADDLKALMRRVPLGAPVFIGR